MITNGEFLQFYLLICDQLLRSFLHPLEFTSAVTLVVHFASVVREPRVKCTREKQSDDRVADDKLHQGDNHKCPSENERREYDDEIPREEIKLRNVAFRLQ